MWSQKYRDTPKVRWTSPIVISTRAVEDFRPFVFLFFWIFSFELGRLAGYFPPASLVSARSAFPFTVLQSNPTTTTNQNSKKKGMSQPPSQASWPAGIPEIRLHPTDLESEELADEAKGWLLFVRVW